MARKVISRKVRAGAPKKNVLSVRPYTRKLGLRVRNSVNAQEKRRASKLQLTQEEKKLLKKTLLPLREKQALKTKLKPGVEAGRVIILLTGPYRGHRAVVLKVLASGLLLISGPHVVNGLPLRRVHQKFIIVTSVKIDLSKVNVPENINDQYFAKPVVARPAAQEAAEGENLFAQRKPVYVLSEQRKQDQIAIDKQVLAAAKAHPEGRLLIQYLASHFYLKNRQYPHQMKF